MSSGPKEGSSTQQEPASSDVGTARNLSKRPRFRQLTLNPQELGSILSPGSGNNNNKLGKSVFSPYAGELKQVYPLKMAASNNTPMARHRRSRWRKYLPSIDWESVRSIAFTLFVSGILYGLAEFFKRFKPDVALADTPMEDILRSIAVVIGCATVIRRILHTIFPILNFFAIVRSLKTTVYTLRSAERPLAWLLAVISVWIWYYHLLQTERAPTEFFNRSMALALCASAFYAARSMVLRYALGKTVEKAYAQKVTYLLKQQDTLHRLTLASQTANAGTRIHRMLAKLLSSNSFLEQVQYLEDHPLTLFEEGSLVPIYSSEKVRRVADSTFSDLLALPQEAIRTRAESVRADAAKWEDIHYGTVIAYDLPDDINISVAHQRTGRADLSTGSRNLRDHPFFNQNPVKGDANDDNDQGNTPRSADNLDTERTNDDHSSESASYAASSPRGSVSSSMINHVRVRPGEIAGFEAHRKRDSAAGPATAGVPAQANKAAPAQVNEPDIGYGHFRSRLDAEAALSVMMLFDRNSSGSISRQEFLDGFVSIYRNFKHLRKSLAGNSSISRAFALVSNMIYAVATIIAALVIFRISWAEFWLPTSAVLVAFSIHIGRLTQSTVQSLMLVLVMKPFEPGDEVSVSNVGGGESMTVESIDLLTTTFKRWTGRLMQVPNYVIFDGSVENYSRSASVNFTITFELGIATSIPQLVEFRERLLLYLRSRPLEWKPQLYVSVDDTKGSQGLMKVSFSITHHLGWKEGGRIYASKTDFIMTALEVMQGLNITYVPPTQSVHVERDTPAPLPQRIPPQFRRDASLSNLRFGHSPSPSALGFSHTNHR